MRKARERDGQSNGRRRLPAAESAFSLLLPIARGLARASRTLRRRHEETHVSTLDVWKSGAGEIERPSRLVRARETLARHDDRLFREHDAEEHARVDRVHRASLAARERVATTRPCVHARARPMDAPGSASRSRRPNSDVIRPRGASRHVPCVRPSCRRARRRVENRRDSRASVSRVVRPRVLGLIVADVVVVDGRCAELGVSSPLRRCVPAVRARDRDASRQGYSFRVIPRRCRRRRVLAERERGDRVRDGHGDHSRVDAGPAA